MKKGFLLFSLFLAIGCVAAGAQASVLDFETLSHTDEELAYLDPAAYTEEGFVITGAASADDTFDTGLGTFGTESEFFAGSTMLFLDNIGGTTTLTQIDSGLFTISAIDLAELLIDDDDPLSFDVTFTGYFADGSSIAETFTLDGSSGPETFLFGSGWTDLVSVSWLQSEYFYQVDNIHVESTGASPVPEPGTLVLLGLSLLGVAGWQKKLLHK